MVWGLKQKKVQKKIPEVFEEGVDVRVKGIRADLTGTKLPKLAKLMDVCFVVNPTSPGAVCSRIPDSITN